MLKKARKLNNPVVVHNRRLANTKPSEDVEMMDHSKPRKITFQDLPWDMIEVILDFIPLNDAIDVNKGTQKVYEVIRLLNRDFYRMINARRKSLVFRDRQITEQVFLDLIAKSTGRFSDIRLMGKTPLTSKRCSIQ
jgi:hypothetical protein